MAGRRAPDPAEIEGPYGLRRRARRLGIAPDDPERFVAELRRWRTAGGDRRADW